MNEAATYSTSTLATIIVAVIGALSLVINGWLVYRQKTKEREQQDREREIAREDRERLSAKELLDSYRADRLDDEKRLAKLEGQYDRVLAINTLLREYAWELISHINQQKPPPPPAWPAGLA